MQYIKNEKGQSLVEFVLVLPILLLLLMGIFEFGVMLNSYLSIQNASRDGARHAAVGHGDSQVVSTVEGVLPIIDTDRLTVVISPAFEVRSRGDKVTVSVTYTHEVMMPIIGAIINDSVNLYAETTMRVE